MEDNNKDSEQKINTDENQQVEKDQASFVEELDSGEKTVEGIIQRFVCHLSEKDIQQAGNRSLIEWFEGFQISDESNLARTVRPDNPILCIEESDSSYFFIEIPRSLWQQ